MEAFLNRKSRKREERDDSKIARLSSCGFSLRRTATTAEVSVSLFFRRTETLDEVEVHTLKS